MADSMRGSDLIKHRYTEKDLERLLEATDVDDARLVDFLPLGIPNPDGGWGVLHVGAEGVASLIQRLIGQQRVPNFHVFPIGIPKPEEFRVVFEAGSAAAH